MKTCITCRHHISAARLAAIPTATQCVDCSTEQPVKGHMYWNHKTAPVFQIVTAEQHGWLQSRDRKGMRSGLPMSSRGAAASTFGSTGPVSPRTASDHTILAETYTTIPRARRCPHTDEPQASSAGKCLACAVAYYAVRTRQVSAGK